MNYIKSLLVLSIFIGFASAGFCDTKQGNLGSKIILKNPNAVSAEANRNSGGCATPFSEVMQNPLINSQVGAFGNMMQGVNNSSYNAHEQQKRQVDYARQQMQYTE